jgi:peptidoglycan hydrolase-like protein with peptidoglycan-binding domain
MRRRLVLTVLISALVVAESASWAQTKPAPKSPAKKPVAARKPAPRKAPARKAASVPQRQSRPTKDRYMEIQQALADAGYFAGPVNGVWNGASVEALRQFQEAEGLEATGKIDAHSLIRLDLGPQYDTPAEPSEASSGDPTG